MIQPSADPLQTTASGSSSAENVPVVRAPSRPAVEFKGLSHQALRLVVHETASDAIDAAFAQLADVDDAGFEWQPVVIDAARLEDGAPIDLQALVDRLRGVRLHPVALAGAPDAMRDEAERLQLGWLAALPERRVRPAAAAAAVAGAAAGAADTAGDAAQAAPSGGAAAAGAGTATGAGAGAGDAASANARPADANRDAAGGADEDPARAEAAAAAALGAMVIDRPVRSGQQVYARERDLVVIGDVSPGAEVIADGNIHVYGTLGGRAIAGARGRRDARIFTLDLRAELVAVCGIYRTFEDGPPAGQAGKPVRISLEADADTLSMRTL
jgi:septum site-determining protein MinC